ncbi:hypothetical protein EIP91_004867 [Steccherinum ochraceum]|uniref:Uncharacterized protein n=1 Tax=Steccherinum ochraceum TaxID=92696 RepID=A0A4R0RB26_9APHY|nr:hypothetical protein EIP91_004867 [Steccherinum ochraceum]
MKSLNLQLKPPTILVLDLPDNISPSMNYKITSFIFALAIAAGVQAASIAPAAAPDPAPRPICYSGLGESCVPGGDSAICCIDGSCLPVDGQFTMYLKLAGFIFALAMAAGIPASPAPAAAPEPEPQNLCMFGFGSVCIPGESSPLCCGGGTTCVFVPSAGTSECQF